MIITSPLSIVPRELEGIYPARFYDIPVSGVWSEKEIEITAELLLDLLKQLPKNTIIVNHMHGHGYQQIVDIVKERTAFTLEDTAVDKSPTDHDSLNALSDTLYTISQKLDNEKRNHIPSKIRRLQAVADFQYGKGVGKILFTKDIKIRSKYPKDLQIFREGKHIASLSSRTGYLSISPSVAQEIIDLAQNKLHFGADYASGSNIYAPGCLNADVSILPNDEIFIVHENTVIATAKAFVSGSDMNKMTSGSLAEVKKKVKVKS
jgi:archaeosine synthase